MPSKTEDYDIVGSYNNQRFPSIDAERSVNLFEYLDPLSKKQKNLISTSGLASTEIQFVGATAGFRAQFIFRNVMYSVIGKNVYRTTSAFVTTQINIGKEFADDSGYVGIDANTHQVIFVDGKKGYIWDDNTSTYTLIIDANFPLLPIDVTFLDGFFVAAAGGTNTFVLSQLNDGLNWTPLQQGALTSHPGTIVAVRTLHRRLFVFSQFFTEVWENAGLGTNLPFRRNNSWLIEYGTPAVGSIAVGFDRMIYLSQDRDGLGSVMEVAGTENMFVSTKALDFVLANYASDPLKGVADARGFFVKENGIIFYRLNFTAANHTFVFGVSMSSPDALKWHEEEVLNGDRHPAQTHVYFNGNNYVGHFSKPILYLLDDKLFTNDGETIRRMRIPKPIVPAGYQRTRIDRLQIDLIQGTIDLLQNTAAQSEIDLLAETGLTILTEAGINIILNQGNTNFTTSTIPPEVFLSISKDGGQTYGYIAQAPMGLLGQRSFRTLWRKLGVIPRGQAFVIKVEFFHHYPFIVLGAAWSYEILPE
jgi:hypothetical protein